MMFQGPGNYEELNARIGNLQGEVEVAQALPGKTMQERKANLLGYEELIQQQSVHKARREQTEKRLGMLLTRRQEPHVKAYAIQLLKSDVLESYMILTEFDEPLRVRIVECVRVVVDGGLEFHFMNGAVSMVRQGLLIKC